jgi:hypothetical protein
LKELFSGEGEDGEDDYDMDMDEIDENHPQYEQYMMMKR